MGDGVWVVALAEELWWRGSDMEGRKGKVAEVVESGSGNDLGFMDFGWGGGFCWGKVVPWLKISCGK
jgi:hypothetical protein